MTAATLWVYLSAGPLLWLTLTVIAYVAADGAAEALGRPPLANPVLIAVAILSAVLSFTGTPYQTFFDGAQFVHFLLGPAIVALALPLYENRGIVASAAAPLAISLVVGAVVAVVSAVGVAMALGAPKSLLVALAPKSVTAGIAMGVAKELGGDPSLAASLVIATGIFGAVALMPLMRALRIDDPRAQGAAAGLAAHGIGTAQALRVNPLAGVFAGIAMGLNGVLTSVLAPALLGMLTG